MRGPQDDRKHANPAPSSSGVVTAAPASKWLHDPAISIPITVATLLGVSFVYRRYLRRIPSAAYITPATLARRARIRAFVVNVNDADGVRVLHTPGAWPFNKLWRIPTDKKLLKDKTINVRIAGVDAPELAHFGKAAQPFAAEAKSFLESLVLQRHVSIDMLSKDHYGRIVGHVWIRKPFWWPTRSNVSLEMAKAGLATVYTAGGAEYGSVGKEKLDAAEAKAKRKRRGMWALSAAKYESPGAYKKRVAST